MADGNQQSDRDRAAIDCANNAKLLAITQILLTEMRNTVLAYLPKQREFNVRTKDRMLRAEGILRQCDGDIVRQEKRLLFLAKAVANRPLKRQSRRAGRDVPLDETRLTCKLEKRRPTTTHHPGKPASGIASLLQRQTVQRDREQYVDKGRDTLLDGYCEEEFEKVCDADSAQGHTSSESHFRTLVDLHLGHYMLSPDPRNESQFGHLETIGALRDKELRVCMLSGLVYYLLQRWDVGWEPFPDFSQWSRWYGIRLIKGRVGNVQVVA
ncbi:centromere DNA-binding protein complex CBF3 subunit [Penicillium sp. DV-2018c]|nr:centromere DNA-binding protein complex CBF3 subunit [Penicillium sp. DV-2018c]KAJ5566832.1 centromere DNA-binding protein complex CBF3 subunit [Penicillium sp. DV-2018c]